MSDRLRTTRATYDQVAARFLSNTRDRSRTAQWLDRFAARVPAGGRVIDLGSGPGCDSAELRLRGLFALSVDLSAGMLRAGSGEFPGPRVQADMRRLPIPDGWAQGVWANASLLHLSPEDLGATLTGLTRACVPRSPLHLSVKRGQGSSWERERYGAPRWFQFWSAAGVDAVLQASGWEILGTWQEETPRDSWLVRLAVSTGPL